MSSRIESVIVVGAGIVGLATARELLSQNQKLRVTILEKESDIGMHQTSHNSGVIHSGIYYPPGSLKAKLCRAGIYLLNEFCNVHKIKQDRCGKLIIATREDEFSRLTRLYKWGTENGVPGLEMFNRETLRQCEPTVEGLKALYLPEVALVDFHEVARALRCEVESMTGKIVLHREVRHIEEIDAHIEVKTDSDHYQADYLVNCGGLYADRIAQMAGCEVPAHIVPFRGEYFELSESWAKRIQHMIYPPPDPELPFLGVHLTPTREGKVHVGPNAVLALSREGYERSDIHAGDMAHLLGFGGFWKMAAKNWRMGLREMTQSLSKSIYLREVQKFLPDLTAHDLMPGGSGVRAQAVDRAGNLVNDFLYVSQPKATHVLNAPSPAATASLAIAKYIVDVLPLHHAS